MDGTIIQQGSFTSTGRPQYLSVRSDIDWMTVYNYTEAGAQNNAHGVQYFWQRGLAARDGFVYIRPAASNAIGLRTSAALAVDGFQLLDTSNAPLGNSTAITSISGANPPVVTVASTAGLYTGNVIRIFNTVGGLQLSGIDFSITVINGTTFSLTNMPAITAAAGPGSYRVVPFDPIYYPDRRIIASIDQNATATISTTVDHGYTVGQAIRMVIPAIFGMQQMNGLIGTVLAVTAGTFTVNIDSRAFTAFAFPLTTQQPFTPAESIPVGEAVNAQGLLGGQPVDILGDATNNVGFIGMTLFPGITGPAGTVGQVIYWVAGKSFNL